MKKTVYVLLATALFISACGGNKGLTPKNEGISGPLGEYFKIVDKTYQSDNGIIYVEVQRIQDGLPEPWEEKCGKHVGWNDGDIEPSFSIEYFDKNGNVVDKSKTLHLGSNHFNDDQDDLQRMVDLSKGETCSIIFDLKSNEAIQFALSSSFEYHPAKEVVKLSPEQEAQVKAMIDRYQQMAVAIITKQKEENVLDLGLYNQSKELANKIRKKFGDCASDQKDRFNDIDYSLTYSATLGPQDNSLDFVEKYSSSESPKADWSSVIDEFEGIVDKYIEVLDASKNGDAKAISEAAEYMKKCEEFSAKLANLNDADITQEQIDRIAEISSKLSNALL